MAKEITGFVKLQVKGGQANPAPPIGPALGSKGLNIMDFCNTKFGGVEEEIGRKKILITTRINSFGNF